ncbi:hypothetical protein DRI50_08405 [candidate division KSB1 bacterium]|nr:MAG: hypothetical protein DRI50_08405 [candidate division KSB1 bacterium]
MRFNSHFFIIYLFCNMPGLLLKNSLPLHSLGNTNARRKNRTFFSFFRRKNESKIYGKKIQRQNIFCSVKKMGHKSYYILQNNFYFSIILLNLFDSISHYIVKEIHHERSH